MHVVVSKKDLLKLLTRCQGVADKKSTMPILGNVLLEVEGPDRLRLNATDLFLAVSGSIAAEVHSGGSVAVGARDLLERVRAMPDGQLSITTNDQAATTIRAVGSPRRFVLHGVPGEEFPTLPEPEPNANALAIDSRALLRLIQATYFSISTDDTRLHLNSALFECEAELVRMVTTDGHRLSKMELLLRGKQASQTTMLIPLKGVLELKRLCEEGASEAKGEGGADVNEIRTLQSGANVFFELGGLRLAVKLVDAQFPPYQQVIPEQSDRSVRAPRLLLIDALKAVQVAASDRTGGIKLTLGSGKMRFESESPETGQGFDEVPVDYDGPDVVVGFNARYFLDVLNAIDDDEVLLGVSGDLDPAVIRPVSASGNTTYIAVVMPMRI